MVPRVDVVTMHRDEPLTRVVELQDTGHSRFPVIGESVDEVIGVVAIGDVVELEPADRATIAAGSLASPPVAVPTTLPLPGVLERLRVARRQLAIVVDEYGGFAGIVSLEDIAEELVGEIRDEDDLPETGLVQGGDGSWVVPARSRLDAVAEVTGVRLPDSDDYETVSGLVMARLGRIPAIGDTLVVDLPQRIDHDGKPIPAEYVRLTVQTIERRVPGIVVMERVA
jgi:CBS domain containing-hemolysin-like protein